MLKRVKEYKREECITYAQCIMCAHIINEIIIISHLTQHSINIFIYKYL